MTEGPTDPDATDQPTEPLVSPAVGDRCVNCGAPLSSDQRYCVVCGERRGAPRFTLPTPTATVTTVSESTRPSSRGPRRPRVGSGTTLIAGVATLLLAMLVGVLIGHSTASNQTKTVAAGTKIITIGGSGAAPASAATTATTPVATGGSGSAHHKSSHSAKSTSKKSSSPPVSKKSAKQLSSAASKVTGGSGGAPPTVTVGAKCPAGTAGCNKKTGKFDGSFFGG